jgi:hypothetical protein
MLICYNHLVMKKVAAVFLLLFAIFLTSATCSRKPDVALKNRFPETLIPDGIGVNIHFPGAPHKDMALIEEAHIKFIRADLTWAHVERKRGHYDFSSYDQLVDSFQLQGGRILFILDYGNRLYADERSMKTENQRSGFAQFAKEAAKRYRGKGVLWEIWNEPNIKQFWGEEPSAEDYMALVKATCSAIREADGEALIIAPATIGLDTKFIRACAEEGLFELVDGVSYHPYREGGPESVLESHRQLEKIIEEFTPQGKERPRIVSSEWGWGLSFMTAEIDGEVDPSLRQAAYLTRRFCIEAYAGVACAIHYKWREDNHGLIKSNYAPKPSYQAFKTLNEQLTRFSRAMTRLEIGSADTNFVFIFEGTSGKKMVAWRTEGSEIVSVPFKGRKAQGVDFLGAPVAFDVRDGVLKLILSEKPLFIEVQ